MTVVRLVRRIILTIGMFLLFACGVDLLFRSQIFSQTLGWLVPWVSLSELDDTTLLVVGGVAWLIPLFYIALAWAESRLARGIGGRGRSGEEIRLTPEAVERAVVKQVKENVEQVLKVRGCEARQAGSAIAVSIRVAVNDDLSVSEAQSRVRAAARRAVEEKIGLGTQPRIHVKITDVIGKPSPGARKRRTAKGSAPEEK